ncbi:MAG: thiol:disulfide interchange protein DsbA [Alteromonadaceae bacterium]|jgi:thiol:disulfide interchange protein DsbA
MKKIAVSFVALLFSTLMFNASAVLQFQEGTHYEVINKTASSKPNVTEFFSFYCPHCYKFEFVAKEIEKQLPEGVTFKKSHVDFMRTTSIETQQALSRAMIAAEKFKMGHKMTDAIFKYIHKDKKNFANVEDIYALAAANGIDGEKFTKAMNSFTVKGAASKMKKAQEDLSNSRALTGVPMFVVNDKYKVISKELKSMEDYQALVQFLLTLKD